MKKNNNEFSNEMRKPKISIVVPIFNAEAYLNRCLDSILKQSYTEYEVLLIDDGSTDSSAEICKTYIESDKRFVYFFQENAGPDMARKSGTEKSKGEFIVYIDSDDYIHEDMLEIMLSVALETETDIVCSQIVRFSGSKEWSGSKCGKQRIILNDKKDVGVAFFDREELIGTYYAKLIKRSVIIDYRFIKDGLIGEDITAALYMFDHASKIVIIPDKLYYYFQNSKSISHAKYSYRHAVSLDNYISLRDDFLERNVVSRSRICGFFAGYQMAVATAMGRKGIYEKKAGKILRDDLREHWGYIVRDKKTAAYMKLCILLYLCFPRMFVYMFRVLYLVTGR